MDKAYNEIVFHNDQSPDLDEINMNAISHGLSVVDDRVIQLKGDLTEVNEYVFEKVYTEAKTETLSFNFVKGHRYLLTMATTTNAKISAYTRVNQGGPNTETIAYNLPSISNLIFVPTISCKYLRLTVTDACNVTLTDTTTLVYMSDTINKKFESHLHWTNGQTATPRDTDVHGKLESMSFNNRKDYCYSTIRNAKRGDRISIKTGYAMALKYIDANGIFRTADEITADAVWERDDSSIIILVRKADSTRDNPKYITPIECENAIVYTSNYEIDNSFSLPKEYDNVLDKLYFEGYGTNNINTGDFISKYFRIPFCEVTNNGVLIVGGDIRYNSKSDVSPIDVGIARSFDGGATFDDKQIVFRRSVISGVSNARIGDSTILVDRNTNRVFLFALRQDTDKGWQAREDSWGYKCETYDDAKARMVYKYSDDDGATWSEEISLESIIDKTTMITAFGGVGKGITMKDGTLVIPLQCKMISDNYRSALPDANGRFYIQCGIMYSTNHGETWNISNLINRCCGEPTVVEYEDGKLMINAKNYHVNNIHYRLIYTSSNMGQTWEAHSTNENTLIDANTKGSLDKINLLGDINVFLFTNPNNETVRKNICIKGSKDLAEWDVISQLYSGECDGYTCICHDENYIYVTREDVGNLHLVRLPLTVIAH